MPNYYAKTALLPEGWENKVVITVDENGWISDIVSGQEYDSTMIKLAGPVIPGMSNVHSHAFQRAMAGLAERSTAERDSFWTWRETMYHFLEKINVDDQQAIAEQLFVEMLKAGFTTVAEFHYLHHQIDGTPYTDRALAAKHIISAAKETGIAITMLPVLYAFSSFGENPPTPQQKRFLNTSLQIIEIIFELISHYKNNPQVTIGLAHHSLRAVNLDMLFHVTREMFSLNSKAPIHIHIAEQIKEVQDCLTWCGEGPVEWLLNHIEVDYRWCLIHATHMTKKETLDLAQTGAVVGICPTTEANLGDGFFKLTDYINANGKFAIGTDSHISVSVIEELRWLEYGQRLLNRQRMIAKNFTSLSNANYLYQQAAIGGAQAVGRATGALTTRTRADFVVLDENVPVMLGKINDFILDAFIFAGNVNPVRDVFVGGVHVIKNYHHDREDEILMKFKKVLAK